MSPAGRRSRSDVAVQLAHERLAEAHDFLVDSALGIEVRSTLAAAQRKGGEGVLEDLFEGEELEDAEVDGRVEAETALVGPDRTVHLDAEAPVDLDLTAIVDPRHPEDDDPLGLDHPLEHFRLEVFGVAVERRPYRLDDLPRRLMELVLGW